MAAVVVGREAELASIRDFVSDVSDGACALVLEGEAGIGKTTLFEAGVAAAREQDLVVLEARPSESETTLSFSALGDLLGGVIDEALAPLPPAQNRALSRALVLGDDEGAVPDPHAVGVAVLNALRGLAAQHLVVVAVDDVQWMDEASGAALGYAGRRLRNERIGILLSRRAPLDSALLGELRRSLPLVREIEVGPVPTAALHGIVRSHLDVTLPRPLLSEVHQASGGNPFYALEIVRTLRRGGISIEAGRPLPVPESLRELIHARLLALSIDSRDYLLAAAAHAHPRTTVVEEASGIERRAGLSPALEAGIVELDEDRIRFTHPLLAAGALEIADPQRRSEIHARLADLLEDPEARAWQLAASVSEPDEEVARALEEAALHARARGAPRPAALLLDRAGELTPPNRRGDALRRAVDAAYLHYESGDSPRAEDELAAAIAMLPVGAQRARAYARLARVRSYEAQADAADLFLQAVEEAEGDPQILAIAHEGVATCLFRTCERLHEALDHARVAAELSLALGDEPLAAEALGTRWVIELLLGDSDAAATGRSALALQPAAEGRRVLAQPRFAAAASDLFWTGHLERARSEFMELLVRAAELGDESSPPTILATLAQVTCEMGELDHARLVARDGQEASAQCGQRTLLSHSLAVESLVEAQSGQVDSARAAARRALELVPETGGRHAELIATRALGIADLASGEDAAAAARLEPVVAFARREEIAEPGPIPFVTDYVEALTALGRRDEAVDVLEWYEGNAERLGRTSALANCARCRGLLAAKSGELDAAIAIYEHALRLHAQVELPLDQGRTLLALGIAQRRAKRRREGRATLEAALAIFERTGAALWAERARAELRRISGRAGSPGELTPAEERVAALVAEGKTNREVASALFLSERTVEGHLTHIFGKLGIKHRSEVGPALAGRHSRHSARVAPK